MRKSRTYLLLSLVTALLTVTVRQAHAVWVETQLTPKNLSVDRLSFTVKCTDEDTLKHFEVAVEPKGDRKLSPGLAARLIIKDGAKPVATIPLEVQWDRDTATYSFGVAPNLLATSRFEFGEYNHGVSKDDNGNVQNVVLPGGKGYWFALSDFADTE